MFLAISLITIALGISLGYLSVFKKFREEHKEIYSFSLTILGTFLGVFLAVHFTRIEENRKEDDLRFRILSATKADTERVMFGNSTNYYLFKTALSKDSTKTYSKFFFKYPNQLKSILEIQNPFSIFSPEVYTALKLEIDLLDEWEKKLTKKDFLTKDDIVEVMRYCYFLSYSLELLNIEFERANGNISNKNLINFVSYFYAKKFNNKINFSKSVKKKIDKYYIDYATNFENDSIRIRESLEIGDKNTAPNKVQNGK